MKTFEVTLTVQTTVLMAATDAFEAKEIMKIRHAHEINGADYEISAEETATDPNDPRVLRP